MNQHDSSVLEQIADAVSEYQQETTGHRPRSVSVMLGEDTLVITLRGGLAPAETHLAKTAAGAAQVQEFHRRLFATSSDSLSQEICRITGQQVCEATAEVIPPGGRIEHSFTTGTVVQVFLLTPKVHADH